MTTSPEQIEELLYQLHDTRQRLSLTQQELIVAKANLNTLIEDPEQGWVDPSELRRELDDAYSRIGGLETELQRARHDARAEKEERLELWSWAGPEIEKLKQEIAILQREKQEIWSMTEPMSKNNDRRP